MLITEDEILPRFMERLSWATEIDLATAWATSHDGLRALRRHRPPPDVRAVVGRWGDLNDPLALRMLATIGRLHGPDTGRHFHPRVFIFRGGGKSVAWDQIDLGAREWRIPGERMKTGAPHAAPLSEAALRTLKTARGLGDGPFVFPSPVRRGSPLAESSLLHILLKTGLAARTTVHGFRSSSRSSAGEWIDADHAVIELCLAHTVGKAVERAYARSDLMDERRALLAARAETIGLP